MISTILEEAVSVSTSLSYNEQKCYTGRAYVVLTHNMPGDDSYSIERTLLDCESHKGIAPQVRCMGFHAAHSPSEEDECTDEEVIAYIQEWMQGMGYGDQPYAIYRHKDTDHRHFHVVSSRIDSNGRKIDKHFENYRSMQLLCELAPKYHFVPGSGSEKILQDSIYYEMKKMQDSEKQKTDSGLSLKTRRVMKREGHSGLKSVFEEALQYDFKTDDDFFAVAEQMGLLIKFNQEEQKKWRMMFQGMSANGYASTKPTFDNKRKTFGYEPYDAYCAALERNRAKDSVNVPSLARVEVVVDHAMDMSSCFADFKKILLKNDVGFHMERSKDGSIREVKLVDYSARSVFDAERLDSDFLAKLKRQKADWYSEQSGRKITKKDYTIPNEETRIAEVIYRISPDVNIPKSNQSEEQVTNLNTLTRTHGK